MIGSTNNDDSRCNNRSSFLQIGWTIHSFQINFPTRFILFMVKALFFASKFVIGYISIHFIGLQYL